MRTKTAARPNRALQSALRGGVNQTAARLCAAAEQARTPLGTSESVRRHLRRILAGEVDVPGEPYLSLLCADTGRTAWDLFGVQDAPTTLRSTFGATSHQFVTTYLGPETVAVVQTATTAEPAEVLGVTCWRAEIRPGVALYLFETGAAIFHVTETVSFGYVAELARWRNRSYRDVLAWASDWLSTAASREAEAGYVFSVYWIDRSRWPSEQLTTAIKLLSVPKIVLAEVGDEDLCGNAEAVEERLLRDGSLDDDRIVDYSLTGVSVGFASWSAVAYHPLLPSRALEVRDFVATQLLTQSTWAFCRHVLDQIEAGEDPDVDENTARRYLRAMRSRAMSPRAQESGQSLAMRRAVYATSHLDDQIDGVLSCL